MTKHYSQSLEARWSPIVLEKGFTAVPNLLISERKRLNINTTDFYVLVALLSWHWDNKMPFPSVATLSKQTGLSGRQIVRSTASLETSGLLRKVRRFGMSNKYDLDSLDEELVYIVMSHLS